MNVRQKLLSGLLVSGLISVSGGMAFQAAIAQETEPVIQNYTEKNIDEYESICARWQGQINKFSRRHTTNYGWFDFSDSRWGGLPVKEIDFWHTCMRNIFQFEAGVEASRKDLGDGCDRRAEDFQKNWVYFPQFTTVSHEFRTDKIGEEFHVYSCRIIVRPSFGRTNVKE